MLGINWLALVNSHGITTIPYVYPQCEHDQGNLYFRTIGRSSNQGNLCRPKHTIEPREHLGSVLRPATSQDDHASKLMVILTADQCSQNRFLNFWNNDMLSMCRARHWLHHRCTKRKRLDQTISSRCFAEKGESEVWYADLLALSLLELSHGANS